VIYQTQTAYYLLLNAIGQEEAARANLANANAVQQAAESSLKNGLATLPDVLEARSAVAEAVYNVQAAIGTEDVDRGNLATALGTSPLQPVSVQSMDRSSRLPLLLRAHGSMSCCNAYRGHRGKRAAYCWSSPIAASETFSAIWRRSLLASAGPAHSSTRTSSPAGSRQRTSCQSGTSPGEWGAINRGKRNRGD
jgi:hypothetical protein